MGLVIKSFAMEKRKCVDSADIRRRLPRFLRVLPFLTLSRLSWISALWVL